MAAQDIYCSPLFKKSREFAERYCDDFFILSAKHGLLSKHHIVAPYDETLTRYNSDALATWGAALRKQIAAEFSRNTVFYMLAGSRYIAPIKNGLKTEGYSLESPLEGLSLGNRLKRLNTWHRAETRHEWIQALYKSLERQFVADQVFRLCDLATTTLPSKGVYIFMDPAEVSAYSAMVPRIVRIGTHGVSLNSKSTLRNRLRTHKGTEAGYGNHRGSIFRLHVGRAIIARDDISDGAQNWGIGSTAPQDIREAEIKLEKYVSETLSQYLVAFIPADDVSSANSVRSDIESGLITLLTEDMAILDTPTNKWLGNYSDREVIAHSGLWNIRHVGARLTPKNLAALKDFGLLET